MDFTISEHPEDWEFTYSGLNRDGTKEGCSRPIQARCYLEALVEARRQVGRANADCSGKYELLEVRKVTNEKDKAIDMATAHLNQEKEK